MATVRAKSTVRTRSSPRPPKRRAIVAKRGPAKAKHGFIRFLVLVVLCLGCAGALALLRWESGMDGLIYPGVSIAGVDVGGHTPADARRELEPVVQQATGSKVTLTAAGRSWTVTPKQLGLQLNVDDRLREAYALGREDSLLQRLATQAEMLVLGRSFSLAGDGDSVDQATLTTYVGTLAAQVDRPMQPASVSVQDGSVTVVPAQNGSQLDRRAATQLLTQAILAGGTSDLALPLSETRPSIPTSEAQAAAQEAALLLLQPLTLTSGTRSWPVSPSQIGDVLAFTPRQDLASGPALEVHVDPGLLAQVLSPMLAGVGQPAVDARFVVQGSSVQLVPSQPGRQVDFVALASAIERRGSAAQLALPFAESQPDLTTAKAQAMGIHDLIISHTTYFPGSSEARLTNIDAAVKHLDGQLIAPGDVFSFNQRIGDITPEGGYVEGIDIVDNRDVPGIGGGVCQVAVTLFQAAIYAGFPILERVNHANIVSYYNPIGMDATVYVSASGPDVKFQNNTGHWVLVSFDEDLPDAQLTVNFFGTDPHFRVVVTGPTATYQKNGDVDAAFTRVVYDASGNELLNHTFTSHYVPVATAVPTATVTVTAQ